MGQTFLEVWKQKGQILEGIKNAVFKQEHIEEIASKRNDVCQSCDLIDRSGDKCFMPGTQPCCGVCGCSLQFLQRSLSSKCEAGKWDAVLSETEANALDNHINSDNERL